MLSGNWPELDHSTLERIGLLRHVPPMQVGIYWNKYFVIQNENYEMNTDDLSPQNASYEEVYFDNFSHWSGLVGFISSAHSYK